jgi:hypothetical protein
MISSFHRTAREVVQEKYNRRVAKMHHPSRRAIILKDIHAGVYGHHASSRAIADKAFCA